jgi:hypothetical protein
MSRMIPVVLLACTLAPCSRISTERPVSPGTAFWMGWQSLWSGATQNPSLYAQCYSRTNKGRVSPDCYDRATLTTRN